MRCDSPRVEIHPAYSATLGFIILTGGVQKSQDRVTLESPGVFELDKGCCAIETCQRNSLRHSSLLPLIPEKSMITMTRALIVLILATCAVARVAAEDSPTTPKERTDFIWTDQMREIDADIKKMNGKIDLAFVGDSITRRWRGEGNKEVWDKYWGSYRAVNIGIGGDATQNVLWRLKNGQLDGYQARVFVVMIGTNNCWGQNPVPADVAAGVNLGRAKPPPPPNTFPPDS